MILVMVILMGLLLTLMIGLMMVIVDDNYWNACNSPLLSFTPLCLSSLKKKVFIQPDLHHGLHQHQHLEVLWHSSSLMIMLNNT